MKNLLVVIDLQKGWRHKTATEKVFLKTVELAKRFSGDVIHCCFRNDPTSLFHSQINWKRFVEPQDTDEIPEITPLHLPIYWRSTYSCLNEETVPLFKKYNHIYIAGVFTDISVASTAMDIFDQNIPVSVVRDCVATLHGQQIHEAALVSLGHAIGRDHLISSKDLVN